MDAAATLEADLNGNEYLDSLPLELAVTDQEVIRELCQQAEGRERDDYALSALRLGVLALKQARGQVDAQALKREGELLLKDVSQALNEHRAHLDSTLSKALKEYFDPTSGRFNERVERLLKKDGELETLLNRKVTAADSEMSRTLTAHIGHGSPIFKLLSPNEAEGVLAALRKTVGDQLNEQRASVLREFSLDNKDGALTRLAGQLCDSNGKLQENLQGKIDGLLKQFSFDDEESALSRMAQTVDRTSQAIARHLTLDDENSALSRLKRELFNVLKSQAEAATKFQEDVRATLERIEVRRRERDASTTHGKDFELELYDVILAEAQRLADVASFCGNSPGRISACKTGDVLIELGPESPAPGAKIALEAKEKKKYSLPEARVEIERARANRDADAGLFVFSKKTAPDGIEPVARIGQDVFVFWNSEDATTDIHLRLGLSVARALCIQKATKREHEAADFEDMDTAILEINKQLEALDEIRACAESIDKNSGKIKDRLRISSEKLRKQVGTLTERLADLKQTTAGA
jgi:hypothetical protein